MSADAVEDEAVLDVRVPTRRRRASDDEADEAEFHDAAEYAASVADSQAVDREGHIAEELSSEDADEGITVQDVVVAGDEELESEERTSEQAQLEDLTADRKKAKLREPFEVPTSGAFWLHDDRFGGEEPNPEPSRPGGATERKARSDTEGRWLHDKFSTLELDNAAEDDSSDNAFSHYPSGRGRGMRGSGRRGGSGGGRTPLTTVGRGRGAGAGRGRGGRLTTSNLEDATSEPGQSAASPSQDPFSPHEALPQRPPRAPRATMRSAMESPIPYAANAGAEAATSTSPVAGRGRGSGARGARTADYSGRGRMERDLSSELPAYPKRSSSLEPAFGGRGRGSSGRGRGREDWGRAGGAVGRGDHYKGAGRGYGRGPDTHESGRASETISSNGGTNDGGRGQGRGYGRSTTGDYQGRGSGPGRGQSSPLQSQQAMHQQRRQERNIDEEFPPLPGSVVMKKPATAPSLGADMPPGVAGSAVVADTTMPATQGVRRYSKMAGKVAGSGSGAADINSGAGGSTASGTTPENGHPRGAGGDGGTAVRASKLSAAAPTFEPSPATAATGRQPTVPQQMQQQTPLGPQQSQVPSVPVAFGAPLQPMTVVATGPPMGAVPEQYGAVLQQQQHGESVPYMHPQQHPQPQAQPVPGTYGAPVQQQVPMPPQGIMAGGGSPMAPPQGAPYSSMGTLMYGASPAEVEAWYQDAYQKALAIGMDPQQAYSAVQGYVQGLKMAAAVVEQQRWQQMGTYAGVTPQQMQAPPAGPYEAVKGGAYDVPKGGVQGA